MEGHILIFLFVKMILKVWLKTKKSIHAPDKMKLTFNRKLNERASYKITSWTRYKNKPYFDNKYKLLYFHEPFGLILFSL